MNGITVPAQYKHMVTVRKTTEDYVDAIKRVVSENKGRAINYSMFSEAMGINSVETHIKRLMKEGHLTRHKIRNHSRGVSYTYKWHHEPLTREKAALTNGEVLTRTLGLPTLHLEQKHLDSLTTLFHKYIEEEENGDNIVAVRKFRQWLQKNHDETVEKRKELLNGNRDSDSSSDNRIH